MKRAFFTSVLLLLGISEHSHATPYERNVLKAQGSLSSTIIAQGWNWGTLGGVPAIWNEKDSNYLLEEVDLELYLSSHQVTPLANAPVWTIEIPVVSREERVENGRRTRAQLDDSTYLLIDNELNLLERRIETLYNGEINIEFKKRVITTPYRYDQRSDLKQNLSPKLADWISAGINQADWEDASGKIQKAPFASICILPFTTTRTLRIGFSPIEAIPIFDIADGDRSTFRERLWSTWRSIVSQKTLGIYGRPSVFTGIVQNGYKFLADSSLNNVEMSKSIWLPNTAPVEMADVLSNPLLCKTKKVAAPVAENAIQFTIAGDLPGSRLWIDQRLFIANPATVSTMSPRFAFSGGIPEKSYFAFNPKENEAIKDLFAIFPKVLSSNIAPFSQAKANGRFRIISQKMSDEGVSELNFIIGPGDPTGWIDIPLSKKSAINTGSIQVEFEVKNSTPEYFGIRVENRDRSIIPIPALERGLLPTDATWVTVKYTLPGPINSIKPMKLMANSVNSFIWESITGIDREVFIRNLKIIPASDETFPELSGALVDPIAAEAKKFDGQTKEQLLASPDRELQLAGLKILKKSPVDLTLVPQIVEMAKAGDFSLSLTAMQLLDQWNVPEIASVLRYGLNVGPYEANRQCAAMILSYRAVDELTRSLTALMVSPDAFTRMWACQALANKTDIDSQAALTLMLGDPDPGVRFYATNGLKTRSKSAGSKLIYAAVNDPSELVRSEAYRNLLLGGPASLMNEATRGRNDESWAVRSSVIETLSDAKPNGALDLIRIAASDRNLKVRVAALIARVKFEDPLSAEEIANFEAETQPVLLNAIKLLYSSKGMQLSSNLANKLKDISD